MSFFTVRGKVFSLNMIIVVRLSHFQRPLDGRVTAPRRARGGQSQLHAKYGKSAQTVTL